ncbi:hypothetical protein ACH5RR_001678 [Cinchona calisaya]|uniref:Hexosyltransferase n=1 Tax=Cinchona calisaya TaxID=153742 RepID=A0ABD3B431_9GENT
MGSNDNNVFVEGALIKGTKNSEGGHNYPPNRAYVTFLAGDGDYVKGAVGLAKGLRKVKTAYPLVVAVLPDVPENHRAMLINQGCIIREIEFVYPPDSDTQFAREDFGVNYSKLRLWKFVEYSKMIYLDADIQVYGNIDHLFDLPDGSFYAAPDSFCETPCQSCPDKVSWPQELGPKPPLYFNAGMFVFEPSLCTHDRLSEALKVTPRTQFAEQDFLNVFFRDICQPLPPIYNFLIVMWWRHPDLVDHDNVKVLHYCASAESKPWRFTANEIENLDSEDMKMLVKKWWDVYNDESLDSQNDFVHNKPDQLAKHSTAALSEVGVVHYVANPSAA